MKNNKIILGIIIGFFFFLLISASTNQTTNEDQGRYHLEYMQESPNFILYDCVTGEYKIIGYHVIRKGSNLKEIFEKE